MKIACYQCPSPAGDLPAGLALIDRALGQAASVGTDMLVLPELILPGYNSFQGGPFDTDAAIAQVADRARKHQVAVTFGLPEVTATATYNTAIALDPAGHELARHRKVQLFGDTEARLFTPGDSLTAFTYKDHRFGLLICYDVEFPEHTRALAQHGCQTLLVPTANMDPYAHVNLSLIPARAQESAINIAYANYCGAEGDLTYVGRSLIASRDGPPTACCGIREGLILGDVGELSLATATLSTQLQELRPNLPISA